MAGPARALALSFLGIALLAGGCQDRAAPVTTQAPAAVATPATRAAAPPTPPESTAERADTPVTPVSSLGPDAWLGQWNGPEGTSPVLDSKPGGGYRLTITSLDGPASYDGDAAGPGIVFERDGQTETLRAGNGKLTGMKWLSEKSDCLIIKAGEGFCRDPAPR